MGVVACRECGLIAHFFPSFCHHICDDASGFLWIADFPQERDPCPAHAIWRLEANVKPQPVNGGYRHFLGLNASERTGQLDERHPRDGYSCAG